jgi:hypothetical protein
MFELRYREENVNLQSKAELEGRQNVEMQTSVKGIEGQLRHREEQLSSLRREIEVLKG